jgi:hypothetical protein
LNILRYEQYLSNNLDQNNLTHGVYWIPQARLVFFIGFGKAMQYPSKLQKICLEPNVFLGYL